VTILAQALPREETDRFEGGAFIYLPSIFFLLLLLLMQLLLLFKTPTTTKP
jgi:hypothetical protein